MPDARRIGLLGGTFDPPHLAHLVVAEFVRDALDLDEVRLLVAGDPWMKHGESAASHRVAMARLAVGDAPRLSVDDREAGRSGATYTADTLTELHAAEPDTEWFFIIGQDAANSLPDWHRVDDALSLATFVVVPRPGDVATEHEYSSRLVRVDAPLVDISSTMIRDRQRAGDSVRFLVPEPVLHYIGEHALYRAADG